jgi:hypothetical protein
MESVPMSTSSRAGIGTTVLVVVGVIGVLFILLLVQYFRQASTRMESAMAHLGSRVMAVSRSCLDETSYRMFGEANGLTARRDLGEALRSFYPPRIGEKKTISRNGDYVAQFSHDVPLTHRAYEKDPDLFIGDSAFGILEQSAFPDTIGLESNDNRGILGVDTRITVKLGPLALERKSRTELEYKTVLLDLPYPFCRYTFFDRCLEADPAVKDCAKMQDRFSSYYCQYEQLRRDTPGLDPFPVLGFEPSVPGPVYSVVARMGDAQYGYRGYTIPAFRGENLLGGSKSEEISDQMLLMARQMFRKASKAEAGELEPYYKLLEAPAWMERRTHSCAQMAEFVRAVSTDGVLDLAGIYWVEGPVVLDHAYRGYGVIVTPDPGGITIRRAVRDATHAGHLTLVSLAGNIQTTGDPGDIYASLASVHGTVRGLQHSRVYGSVYVSYLANDTEDGPEIQRPLDADWKPVAKVTDRPALGLARRLRAFIGPRCIRIGDVTTRGRW